MSQDIAKLSKELSFIEDSFKSGIITRVEHDAAKKRVDEKIAALKQEQLQLQKAEKAESNEKILEQPKPNIPSQEKKPEKSVDSKLEVYYEKAVEPEQPRTEPIKDEKQPQTEKKDVPKEKVKLRTYGRRISPVIVFSLIVIIAIAALVFYVSNLKSQVPAFVPVCTNDLDCQKTGYIGTCIFPSTKDANCTFDLENPTNITIITSKNCVICDTTRIENTLVQLYPGSSITVIDADNAKSLISNLGINVLPAVVFDNSLADTKRFNSNTSSTKSTVKKIGRYYLMNPQASGSNYFFENKFEKNDIELFLSPDSLTSVKAFQNLVLLSKNLSIHVTVSFYSKAMPDRELSRELCIKSDFSSKLVPYLGCLFASSTTEENAVKCMDQNSISKSNVETCIEDNAASLLQDNNDRAAEFYINTLPVFVFNNQYKKGGSLSVDILRSTYCAINGC